MKLRQHSGTKLQVFEIGNSSLKITEGILIKRTEEILFEDIHIKDLYELKYHDRQALGYVAFFMAFFVFFLFEFIFSPDFVRTPFIVVTVLTILSIIHYLNAPIKIYIPTTNKGTIKLFQKRPSGTKVKEFLYVLEGKVKLAEKKVSVKEDLSHFLRRD